MEQKRLICWIPRKCQQESLSIVLTWKRQLGILKLTWCRDLAGNQPLGTSFTTPCSRLTLKTLECSGTTPYKTKSQMVDSKESVVSALCEHRSTIWSAILGSQSDWSPVTRTRSQSTGSAAQWFQFSTSMWQSESKSRWFKKFSPGLMDPSHWLSF